MQEEDRFSQDMLFLDRHRHELLQKFREQWIAVYNQKVVGTAEDLKDLIEQLKEKGIAPATVYREYLTDRDELLILPAAGL